VNVTLVLDEQPLTGARLKAEALGKSLDELIGELLQRTLAEDDKRSIEEFERLSGQGNSLGATFTEKKFTSVARCAQRGRTPFPQLSTTKFPLSVTSNLY
jgi:hypothetical protein